MFRGLVIRGRDINTKSLYVVYGRIFTYDLIIVVEFGFVDNFWSVTVELKSLYTIYTLSTPASLNKEGQETDAMIAGAVFLTLLTRTGGKIPSLA